MIFLATVSSVLFKNKWDCVSIDLCKTALCSNERGRKRPHLSVKKTMAAVTGRNLAERRAMSNPVKKILKAVRRKDQLKTAASFMDMLMRKF